MSGLWRHQLRRWKSVNNGDVRDWAETGYTVSLTLFHPSSSFRSRPFQILYPRINPVSKLGNWGLSTCRDLSAPTSELAGPSRKRSHEDKHRMSRVTTMSPLRHYNSNPYFETSDLQPFMAPSTYQAQLLSSFIYTISKSARTELAPRFPFHSLWLSEIAKSIIMSATLTWALRALSLAHLGHQVQDENLIQKSRKMYGKALLHLHRSL